MGESVLVLGGARSGKSRFAEQLATDRAPVTYVATAVCDRGDAEMAARIALHRSRRPDTWATVEVQMDLAGALVGASGQEGTVLVDCVTLWISNLMLGIGGGTSLGDAAILAECDRALAASRPGASRTIWVSNELGSGIVPANPLARRFADLQGLVNQRLAAACDAVHLCVAGISLRLK
jgi:adenosylcobinamide kinase/adenosylcobinamide-phosphate guanylyltransferase